MSNHPRNPEIRVNVKQSKVFLMLSSFHILNSERRASRSVGLPAVFSSRSHDVKSLRLSQFDPRTLTSDATSQIPPLFFFFFCLSKLFISDLLFLSAVIRLSLNLSNTHGEETTFLRFHLLFGEEDVGNGEMVTCEAGWVEDGGG